MVKLLLQASRQSYSPFLCNARLMDPNWVGKDGSPASARLVCNKRCASVVAVRHL